jgi:hypothetical protein
LQQIYRCIAQISFFLGVEHGHEGAGVQHHRGASQGGVFNLFWELLIMTIVFKSSIAAAAAVFALSGIANAQSVTISLDGKDAQTVHAEIVKAAYQVCRDTRPDSILLTNEADCVFDTIAKADAQARNLLTAPIRKAELSADLRGQR